MALRAYWELPAMVLQFLRNGVSAVPATVQLSQGLIRNQRLRGYRRIRSRLRRVGSRQKTLVDTFVNAGGTRRQIRRAAGIVIRCDNHFRR